MRRARNVLIALLVGLCALEAAALGWCWWRARREAGATVGAVDRGRELAERLGCFGCHGPGGRAPIPNPGSVYGRVPDWSDTPTMALNSPDDVRGWIVDGRPPGRPPDAQAQIRMPPYGDLLRPGERDDLVAYVLAVARLPEPADPLPRRGRAVAERAGCFGCHGPAGRGTVRNPGSLRGYVPGWDGEDYADLVRSDDEFREWVRDGSPARLRANPLARAFLDAQRTHMPAYRDVLEADEIEAILAYVKWLRAEAR